MVLKALENWDHSKKTKNPTTKKKPHRLALLFFAHFPSSHSLPTSEYFFQPVFVSHLTLITCNHLIIMTHLLSHLLLLSSSYFFLCPVSFLSKILHGLNHNPPSQTNAFPKQHDLHTGKNLYKSK